MLRKHKRLTKKELKKDPLVIFTAQAVDYLRKEWLKIGSTVLAVVLVISISLIVVKGRRKSAMNAYDAAMTAIANDAPEALDLLKRVVEDHEGSKRAGDALIKLGNSYFQLNDLDSAEKYYSQYINRFSNDPVYTFNAYNGLGGVYEEKGEYGKAGETYEKYIKKHKNSIFISNMCLNAGKAYYLSGDKDSARRNFLIITNDYKDSREKQEASYFLGLLN